MYPYNQEATPAPHSRFLSKAQGATQTAPQPRRRAINAHSVKDSDDFPPVQSLGQTHHELDRSPPEYDNNQEDLALDTENWVTVFGFPDSLRSTLLSDLGHMGNITKQYTPEKGNYMHICLSSGKQAQGFIEKNGFEIHGNMIGIRKSTPRHIEEAKRSGSSHHHRATISQKDLPSYIRNTSNKAGVVNRSLLSKILEYIFGF